MKQKKLKSKVIIIIISYYLLLLLCNVYFRSEYDNLKKDTQALIIISNEDPIDLINNATGITSKKRALSFYQGEDNDIIYSPEIIYYPNGAASYAEEVDDSKLLWSDISNIHNFIYAFSASDCNIELNKNEVILQIHGIDEKYNKLSNFLNKEISFKHNDTLILFNIKEIKEADIYEHICISDELYNELLTNEEKYIYALRFDKYKNFENTQNNLLSIEQERNLLLDFPSKNYDNSNKESNLGNIIDFITILNWISIVIFIILIISLIISSLTKQLNKID